MNRIAIACDDCGRSCAIDAYAARAVHTGSYVCSLCEGGHPRPDHLMNEDAEVVDVRA